MHISTARKQIDVFDTDVFLVSYPRSGNTWMRWLLAVCVKGCRDVDRPEVIHTTIPDIYRATNEHLLTLPHPRIIKSHETYNAGYPRVIYIYRDVRDVIISLFFYFRKYGHRNHFGSFFEEFTRGMVFRELGFGSWEENVMGWLEHGDRIASVKYEDLLADTQSVLERTLDRVGVEHDKSLLGYAAERCTFEQMREIDRSQDIERRPDLMVAGALPNIPFIRSGSKGQWKGFFNAAQIDIVKQRYGDLLIKLGYETSHDW